MTRLKQKYEKEIKKEMADKFSYKNGLEIPKIVKISINVGVGRAVADVKNLEFVESRLAAITGQKALRIKAKKSISNFKLREKMPISAVVTLRGKRMYDFLDRLINIAIPRIRDFRGTSDTAFDGKGNYSLGIKDHTVFPEITHEDQGHSFSLQINIITSAKNNEEAKNLLSGFGFPFKKRSE